MTTAQMQYGNLSPREVNDLQSRGEPIDLVDVRSASEFDAGHAAGARLLPLNEVNAQSIRTQRRGSSESPFYIICQSGGRSRTACDRLARQGVSCVNVDGGTAAWKRAGLPMEANACARRALPRAIRIGGIVLSLVAFVLGVTVHPLFFFVGFALWIALMVANRGCPFCE